MDLLDDFNFKIIHADFSNDRFWFLEGDRYLFQQLIYGYVSLSSNLPQYLLVLTLSVAEKTE